MEINEKHTVYLPGRSVQVVTVRERAEDSWRQTIQALFISQQLITLHAQQHLENSAVQIDCASSKITGAWKQLQ